MGTELAACGTTFQLRECSTETLLRYQKKFNALNSFAHSRGISEPSDGLFQEYLSDNKNKYTGEYSVFKDRQRIRVVNLIKSYITNGEADTSRRKGKSAYDSIQTEQLKKELDRFITILEEEPLRPNTIYTYKRIVAYLLIYCEKKSYRSINELVSGDIRNFILYLYEQGYFKPTTITSGLSGLRLRVSELINLAVSSLHLEPEVPYVTILGKGLKYRNIPLMSKTVQHLNTYLSEFHPVMKMDAPLFYATTHGVRHPLSDDTIQKLLKKYTNICRNTIPMPKEVHFHMLRKTRAMDLYQAGCPLSYIQQLLGHENISTTRGFYAFATLKTLADAIEKTNPSGSEEKLWKKESVLKQLYRL